MRIAGTQVNLNQDAFEIYVAGCLPPRCPGCHNAELWDFRVGELVTPPSLELLQEKIKGNELIDKVWLLGGEPLAQHPDDLMDLLNMLRSTGKEIWLWTRYPLNEVPTRFKLMTDYIKTGRYEKDNLTGPDDPVYYGVPLASRNQRIFKYGVDYCTPKDRKKIYPEPITSECIGGEDGSSPTEGAD